MWKFVIERALPASKVFVKLVLGISAFGVALITIFAWWPLAKDTLFPFEKDYKKLAELGAGFSTDHFSEMLGAPTTLKQVSSNPALKQINYINKDYIVTTVADDSGRTLLFSVLSCNPDFHPRFTAPDKTELQLQMEPLELIAPRNLNHDLYYKPGSTGSSVDQLVELGDPTTTTANRLRAYAYGVNGACGPTRLERPDGIHELDYSGPINEAPDDVKDFRRDLAANFYTETVGWDLRLVDPGALKVSAIDSASGLNVQPQTTDTVPLSPLRFDLPTYFINPKGTKTFTR
ncbi:ETEC_3214 domain-containing protein [Arthrobacter sp. H16F315]|uniref:ETEC_3214 domain-containing protein n=1 Tax=Arthrobacter sp. H16F315 TaxID=2955314 RepID=UPI00209703E7|nr:ETEC_3214 domain-containing protein [Arthrobacter sp. H16F315]MDD1476471.1 hypothetical protein [Arthrobacter sp. H16F315]